MAEVLLIAAFTGFVLWLVERGNVPGSAPVRAEVVTSDRRHDR